ncbi:exosome complex component RRP46-like [Uloborus diversus]|uniref:exosome complex component RRP46-like n=1 Tax=Uloborus diversus TaxID=327109 RepID=UPI002409D330|nr:exosome complex component RRP46-like [Uloborus diversus]
MHAVQFSNLSRSDGSVLMSSGDVIVQACVYGPTEIKVSKELCNKAAVEVSFKPKVGQSDSEERLMEHFIRNAVEPLILTSLHPRTSINIIIQEIQDGGNLLACGVNSAYLALLDAGISMTGSVAAVPIAVFKDKLIPFPTGKEVKAARGVTVICIGSPGQNILGIKSGSFVSSEELQKCISIARNSAENLFQFYRDSVSKQYKASVA